MIGYPSRQDGAISPAWDFPLCPAKKSPESHIINSLLTKLVRSRWLEIGLVLVLSVYGPRVRFSPQNVTKRKKNWPTSSLIIWLAPWSGRTNQITRCDWLPERARWSYLARLGLPAVSCKKKPRKPYNEYFIEQAFFASLWTSTSLRSINMQKKNLANIHCSHLDLTLGQ